MNHYTLSAPLGNNIFAYEKRKALGFNAELTISSVQTISSLYEVQVGSFIVFEEINHQNIVQSCTGLGHTYLLHTSKCSIVITDNHNHVLPYRLKHISKHNNQKIQLIHIDQHSDLGINPHTLDISQLDKHQYQWNFSHLECNIGNFITPCIKSGLLSDMIQVRTEYKLNETYHQLNNVTKELIIVDIDLDFRAPEMGIQDRQKTFHQVRSLMNHASLITIASSPYFINQSFAITLLHELVGPWLENQQLNDIT